MRFGTGEAVVWGGLEEIEYMEKLSGKCQGEP